VWIPALCKKYRVGSETISAVRVQINQLLPSTNLGSAPELKAWFLRADLVTKAKSNAATVHPNTNEPTIQETLLGILQRIVGQYSDKFIVLHGARLLAIITTQMCVNADAAFTDDDHADEESMDSLDDCLLILATIAIEEAVFGKPSFRNLVAGLLQHCFSAADQTTCQEKLRDLRDQQLSQSDFDIPVGNRSSTGYQLAVASLDGIGEYRSPTAKLLCIVAASQQIAQELSERNGGRACGADQTLPVYNFVVSRTFVLQEGPLQTMQMLWHLTDKRLQNGEMGYCLVQFNTAFDYLVRTPWSAGVTDEVKKERRRSPSTVAALSAGLVAASIGMTHRRRAEELMASGMITEFEHAKLLDAEAELARMTAELMEWERNQRRRRAGSGAGAGVEQGDGLRRIRSRSRSRSGSIEQRFSAPDVAFVAAGGF
jgi:hypothetical protein